MRIGVEWGQGHAPGNWCGGCMAEVLWEVITMVRVSNVKSNSQQVTQSQAHRPKREEGPTIHLASSALAPPGIVHQIAPTFHHKQSLAELGQVLCWASVG